jgi:hypothetical protein
MLAAQIFPFLDQRLKTNATTAPTGGRDRSILTFPLPFRKSWGAGQGLEGSVVRCSTKLEPAEAGYLQATSRPSLSQSKIYRRAPALRSESVPPILPTQEQASSLPVKHKPYRLPKLLPKEYR